MRKFSADFIFNAASDPIKNGIVITEDDGTVVDVIDPSAGFDGELTDVEYHRGAICPGFINAHCHLELSHLKDKVEPHTGLTNFILKLQQVRQDEPELIKEAAEKAEAELRKEGIVAVGDISNDNFSFDIKSRSSVRFHTFVEVLGFAAHQAEKSYLKGVALCNELDQRGLSNSLVPHSPYSVSKKLFQILKTHHQDNPGPVSIHNQESEAENVFYETGNGAMAEMLKNFGLSLDDFNACGRSSLQCYAEELPDKKTLFVHNTFTTKADIERADLFVQDAWWCFCPNANLYIESRVPDVKLFEHLDTRITLGTDSLAATHRLSILEEMKTLQFHFPHLSLQTLVKWATRNGAEFFDYNDLGTIDNGKRPGLNLINYTDGLKLKSSSTITKLL